MSSKTIPIADESQASSPMRLPVPITGRIRFENGHLIDERGRPLRDLRISLTDHCNFRCRYCMPKESFSKKRHFLAMTELLTFEEILRVSRIAVANGIEKLRLTGGEPLLRKGIENLIADLRKLKTPDGRDIDIAMTTNGSLLARKAQALRDAGLDRLTVSLDAIDEAIFQGFNDVGYPAAKVLEAIDHAQRIGFPVKVNTVIKRGVNEGEILRICERFRGTGVIPRFIEYMDAGTANGWRMDDVVPSAELVERINAVWPIEPIDPNYTGETATRWRYKDGAGEIGFISSVTQAFCRDCSRVRLSIEGSLVLCLFADRGYDLRTLLRGGATDDEIADAIARIWSARDDHYSEIRLSETQKRSRSRIEMQFIGG